MALGVRRQSEDCSSTARRNAECTSETKPQGIANSRMQSRDSLRDTPEMHCKISSSKNKQEQMNCRKNENILRNKQIQQNLKYEWHNKRGKH